MTSEASFPERRCGAHVARRDARSTRPQTVRGITLVPTLAHYEQAVYAVRRTVDPITPLATCEEIVAHAWGVTL